MPGCITDRDTGQSSRIPSTVFITPLCSSVCLLSGCMNEEVSVEGLDRDAGLRWTGCRRRRVRTSVRACPKQAPGKLSPSWLGQRLNHSGSVTYFGAFSFHTQMRTHAEATRLLAPGRGLQMEKQEKPGGRNPCRCGPTEDGETHTCHSAVLRGILHCHVVLQRQQYVFIPFIFSPSSLDDITRLSCFI